MIMQVGWFVAKSESVLQIPSNPSINAAGGVSGFHGDNWCGSLATPSGKTVGPAATQPE
jgi:hypothetical protein